MLVVPDDDVGLALGGDEREQVQAFAGDGAGVGLRELGEGRDLQVRQAVAAGGPPGSGEEAVHEQGALGGAVAGRQRDGPFAGDDPAAALELVDQLGLGDYHLYHSTRANLLRRLGRAGEAATAYDAAIALAGNDAERAFLQRQRDGLGNGTG